MTRWLLFAAAATAATSSCGRHGDPDRGNPQPSPSASLISVGVEMGACTDLAACARECDAGSSDRCRRMGVSYEFGKGVDADLVHATELYEKACAMGDSEGCISAGRMHEFHHGVPKNEARAVGFYERACDLRNPAGCANLAIMLQSGRGTSKDAPRAARLFDQACASGSGLACERGKALRALQDAAASEG